MKNFITLLIVLAGLGLSDLNAQTCCKSQEDCKPKVCCPTATDCCEDGKGFFGFFTRLFKNDSKVAESKNEPSECTSTVVIREEKVTDPSTKK